VALAGAVAGGAALAWRAGSSSASSDSSADGGPVLATATVTQGDLVLEDETSATLGFILNTTMISPVEGTVTSVGDTGETIEAGTVVASIDGQPVVALIGDVPSWRELSTSSEDGVDVRQLEMNLVALGFDPDGEIEIDETYDSATASAVTEWEEALGLDGDGEVDASQIVFVPGSVIVDEVAAQPGGSVQTGEPLVSGRVLDRQFDIAATLDGGGAIGSLAPAGTPVETGTVLFGQGGVPVAAVVGDFSTSPALDRDLSVGVDSGTDVEQLETMLSEAGYNADGALEVDDSFDEATGEAYLAWRAGVGWPAEEGTEAADVVVPAGSLVTVPSGLSVTGSVVADGDELAADQPVLTIGEATRRITTTTALGDDAFELGAVMAVEFPDGTVLDGEVVTVDSVLSTDPDGGTSTVVDVGIEVAGEIPELFAEFVEVPVTLRVPGESELGVLIVPVSALVALAEGGYAVEVVIDDGTAAGDTAAGDTAAGDTAAGDTITKLVAVEPGLFADGFLSVSSDELSAGDEVVVPS
jgi:peptidoglycan hydrolase-like protein with peptidoglycan-binding domain